MPSPLVTVICLCYNQARFVREAIESVLAQTYPAVQLIVVDDASTDESVGVIKALAQLHHSIEFLPLTQNLGNCAAFNKGLALAKGNYLIDLAADDVLLPERISVGVNTLLQTGSNYGVHFSDAEWIDENGNHLRFHSDRFPHATIPQGNIYQSLISHYFICSPTVMFTREVIAYLGGYDETLTYEDFDFWIRSSRKFNYAYSPQVLVKKRVTTGAMANKQFRVWSSDSQTTYRVCEKIFELNETRDERKVLAERIGYEIKLNVRLLNFKTAVKFIFLWIRNVRLNRVAFVLFLYLMITAFTC